ncbi:MAG: hypothetical protein JKY49_00245 [Cohaesibacteraceae bacterium]|nr:hypothetical protein [Cohaesibacteraceae bacterium]
MKSLLRTPAASLFVLVLPFSFYPKLIDGDTQPWPLLASLLLFGLSRRAKQMSRLDLLMVAVTIASFIVYFPRSGFNQDLARFAYKLIAFNLLWFCVPSLPPVLVSRAMRWVIAIWFIVGLLQTLAMMLGIDVSYSGRFVPGRSGVPSLAPEPSLYGTLSIVALLYLIASKDGVRPAYIFMAFANVFLSGSILSILVSALVVLFFGYRTKLVLVTLALGLGFFILSSDLLFLSRVNNIIDSGLKLELLLLDYSINLRVGHIIYTLWEVLPSALIFQTSAEFGNEYNLWVAKNQLFYPTGSDFILTGMGNIIYRGGIFGLLVLVLVFVTAYRLTPERRVFKLMVLGGLMLAQLDLSSPFIILYALQRKER